MSTESDNIIVAYHKDQDIWIVSRRDSAIEPWFAKTEAESRVLGEVLQTITGKGEKLMLSMQQIGRLTEQSVNLSMENKHRLVQYLGQLKKP